MLCIYNILYISSLFYFFRWRVISYQKTQMYVESEPAFFNTFLKGGLTFSSSLYLSLICIRILKYVSKPIWSGRENEADSSLLSQFSPDNNNGCQCWWIFWLLKSICIGFLVKWPMEKCCIISILSKEGGKDDGPWNFSIGVTQQNESEY